MSKFIYICNVRKDKILKAIQNHECYDSWGEVQYGNDERAVEYNICIDNTTEETIYCSAFYGLLKNKDGCWQHIILRDITKDGKNVLMKYPMMGVKTLDMMRQYCLMKLQIQKRLLDIILCIMKKIL